MDAGPMGVSVQQRPRAGGAHRGGDAVGVHITDGVGNRGRVGLASGASRARQCTALRGGKTEKSPLPVRIPHRGAQPLIGPVVGAKRVAVHDQHGLAIQGHDDGVGQELSARSFAKRPSQQKIPIAVHDEARHSLGSQRSNGIQGLGLAGIRGVVSDPRFE